MRARYDRAQGVLTLAFDDREGIEAFVGATREQEGFLAALPEPPGRGTEVAVVLSGPGGFELRLEAEALHVFGEAADGYTTAFQLRGWNAARSAELRRKLGDATAAEAPDEAGGETLGGSPAFRIQRLTPPEKARLALRAGRVERQILLRETSAQVMTALLNNPHLETDDVLQMVRSPNAAASVLKRVAGESRWAANLDVRLSLVRHPQTPAPLARSLLPGLPLSALQALARGSDVRDDLKKAALKLYLARMGK